jgi:hypothetical protein
MTKISPETSAVLDAIFRANSQQKNSYAAAIMAAIHQVMPEKMDESKSTGSRSLDNANKLVAVNRQLIRLDLLEIVRELENYEELNNV